MPLDADPVLRALHRSLGKHGHGDERSRTLAAEAQGLLWNAALAAGLERRRGRIDCVYERASLWSLAGLQFARRRGVPYVLELNAPLVEQQRLYRRIELVPVAEAIESSLLAGADLVLVTTTALAEYAHARGASRRKIRLLPCGAPARMLSAGKVRPRRRGEEFVVGFLGSLKPWHGVDLLVRAFRRLVSLDGRYRLLVVGDGPLRAEVEKLRSLAPLRDKVRIVGPVPHFRVLSYLAKMDVGLAPYPPLPSFYFSPLKVWEYAAAGVPIVATASGDLPSQFPHKQAALLHPPGSVKKIVEHVELLRKNPELAVRLARRARRVARRHTWDRHAARFESLLGKLGPRWSVPGPC
ncbi:MAG: glycosyl transferase [Candidatus Binatia bacterium]|nr:MAG: glycosyl transferase [Candidatus Binatia bacterium]